MNFRLKTICVLVAALSAGSVMAAQSGGFATTDGGNKAGALERTAKTMEEMNAAIAEAAAAQKPLILTYTGNEDARIAERIKGHTVDASGNCPKPYWNETYRKVEVKDFTYGLTIIGANGSSANFGIPIIGSKDVIVRNMKIGALGGAANDADMIRIDSSTNIWIDHNELFSVNNECKGSPEGDLTFEGALDIKKSSENITISYNYIHDHKKVGLDGADSKKDAGMRHITFHHNIYKNVASRLPLQRGGRTHMYNNHYDGITKTGINIRAGGVSLVEYNYFENSHDPVMAGDDGGLPYGKWELRGNNATSAADNAKYNIKWSTSGGKYASDWQTTPGFVFPEKLPYVYEPVSAACVKAKLASYAGVGKNGAVLTASACGGSAASSSAAASSKASSSAASSAASSSKSSSASSSGAPALTGTGDWPDGFVKCADLGETCTAKSSGWVAFGRKGKWVSKYVGAGKTIACTVAAFGSDPQGNPNKCSTK